MAVAIVGAQQRPEAIGIDAQIKSLAGHCRAIGDQRRLGPGCAFTRHCLAQRRVAGVQVFRCKRFGLILDLVGCKCSERAITDRSEEHTSELQSLMRISYAVFCLKKKNKVNTQKLYQNSTN